MITFEEWFERVYPAAGQIPRDNFPPHVWRVSNLVGCPQKSAYNHEARTPHYSDDAKRHFVLGHGIHSLEEWKNKQMLNGHVIMTEKRLFVDFLDDRGDVFLTLKGTMDALKVDLKGGYIEDYKTIKLRNGSVRDLYVKMKSFPDHRVVLQESLYAYLIYVNTGMLIEHGVITYIDKRNPRNRFSGEVQLYTPEYVEDYILNHPAITGNKKAMATRTKDHVLNNRWECDYCDWCNKCSYSAKRG